MIILIFTHFLFNINETLYFREKLASVFNIVREVNVLDSKDESNLAVLQRPELGITFTKLHCWRLTEYEKCVFVDADALVSIVNYNFNTLGATNVSIIMKTTF